MTDQVNAYRQTFQDSLELELSVTQSVLTSRVMNGNHTGGEKTRLILRAGSKNARPRTTRNDPMVIGDISLQQRWVTGYAWDVDPDTVDDMDKARMGIDPGGYITMAHAAAIARIKDQEVIDAFFADAKVGDDAGSTVSFDTNNTVAASSSGLTVAKLRAAQKVLLDNHVDITRERPCLAITPQQHDDLLADIQAVSADYNGGQAPLKDGLLQNFMGFDFVMIASDADNDFGLPKVSSNRRCPFWVKSGMHYGTWQAPQAHVDFRTDLRGKPLQFYTKGDHGATRVEEGKVGEILCVEA